jgi:hypothetical protein
MSRTAVTLFAHWNKARGARMAPQHCDIKPGLIAHALAETFIIEQKVADDHLFRLAGTRVCEIFGGEMRGRSFLKVWDHNHVASVVELLDQVRGHKGVGVITLIACTDGLESVSCEVLLMPLVYASSGITRIMGCISPVGTPLWMGEKPVSRLVMRKKRLIHMHTRERRFGKRITDMTVPVREVKTARCHFLVYEGGNGAAKAPGTKTSPQQ